MVRNNFNFGGGVINILITLMIIRVPSGTHDQWSCSLVELWPYNRVLYGEKGYLATVIEFQQQSMWELQWLYFRMVNVLVLSINSRG